MNRPRKPLVHFIGIGGIGISALARWFLAQNWAVSGSDLSKSLITRDLKKEGCKVKIGHRKANLARKTALVVYNQAISRGNPELLQARQLRIPSYSYPEAIGVLTRNYRTVAVAGSHGKSTVTALVALIMRTAGLDPTVIVGTKLKEFEGKNFRMGSGPYLVLEADEWRASFLKYSPAFVILTNIDREHLDFYKNLKNVKASFLKFLKRARPNGPALSLPNGLFVLNRDDKNLFSLRRAVEKIAHERNVKIIWYSLREKAAGKIRHVIQIPGAHNVSNALAAFSLCAALGINERTILRALGRYRGAWRRMEYRGSFEGAPVFDDYAHHPTEIKATIGAFKEKFPKKKILCVFQPHQAKRLAGLFKEFQHAFDLADITLVLPLYKVPGRDEKIVRDSEALVRAIQKREPKKLIFYLQNPQNLKSALAALLLQSNSPRKSASSLRQSAVVVMMGAGDIFELTGSLVS